MQESNHHLHSQLARRTICAGSNAKRRARAGPSPLRFRIVAALRPPNRWQRRSDRPLTRPKTLRRMRACPGYQPRLKNQKKLVTNCKPSTAIRLIRLKSSTRSNSQDDSNLQAKSRQLRCHSLGFAKCLGLMKMAPIRQAAGIGTLSARGSRCPRADRRTECATSGQPANVFRRCSRAHPTPAGVKVTVSFPPPRPLPLTSYKTLLDFCRMPRRVHGQED